MPPMTHKAATIQKNVTAYYNIDHVQTSIQYLVF